jgi:gliding motility-associated-like protein
MTVQTKRAVLLLWIIISPFQTLFSQHSTRNDYTGSWETPASWNPVWASPQTNISGYDITVNGYITINSSLSFSGTSNSLIINDTLIIRGDLNLSNNNRLTIMNNGILILKGNLTIDNETDITANGYFIITGSIIKIGTSHHGSFISNDNPVKVFIGGTSNLGTSESSYPVLNCPAKITTAFPGSHCSYGNMADLANDPINSFFQSTFIAVVSTADPGKACAGTGIQLNAAVIGGSGSYTYSWTSVPAGFISSVSNPVVYPAVSTIYKISVSDGYATTSSQVSVIINALPATPGITAAGSTTFCAGSSVKLTSGTGAGYLWSNGATTASIIVSSSETFTVKVTNANGCQSASSAETIIKVNAIPSAPLITASGPVTFCEGGKVTLTSDSGAGYLWSTGAKTSAISVSAKGGYAVMITDLNGCQSPYSGLTVVTVIEIPVAKSGPDQELKQIFETTMEAELSSPGSGEWSVVTGTGQFADIHSPVTKVTGLSVGENVFLWKVINGICEASDEVDITVLDLFIPSVITPDGDGVNDFFVIGESTGSMQLIIFNRWGNEEFKNGNYLNDWNGLNNKGQELPGETYFYILKMENGIIRKGSVLILR